MAMGPGELCSTVLLAFGLSFVFGRVVATVAFDGSMSTLLLGWVIGLTFAAAGAIVLCVSEERGRTHRTLETSSSFVLATLTPTLLFGLVLGALF